MKNTTHKAQHTRHNTQGTIGLFETMRSLNGRIVYLDQHLNRIIKSSKKIGLKFPLTYKKAKLIIVNAVKRSSLIDARVRFTVWKKLKKPEFSILVRKYLPFSNNKYNLGFSVCVSGIKQDEQPGLSRIKTINRMRYERAYKKAKLSGFDEAILLNSKGFLAEATRSNIFFVENNILYTPTLDCGCLDGITRRVVIDIAKRNSIKFCAGSFLLRQIKQTEEAFLTNSLIGIMAVTKLEGKKLGDGKCGRLTKFFIEKYNCLLR